MFSIFLLAFIAVEAKSCTEEEFCPAAEVLVEASITFELLPLIFPLEVYRNRKGEQSAVEEGQRKQRRGEARIDLEGLILQCQMTLTFCVSLVS